jgi:hypothetical protein
MRVPRDVRMNTTPNHLSRRFMIHVCKDGTITYRDTSTREHVFNGIALPVFSVDTVAQAQALQVRFGRLAHEEHPLMPGKVLVPVKHARWGGALAPVVGAGGLGPGDGVVSRLVQAGGEPLCLSTWDGAQC